MLLSRRATGDREKARALLNQALAAAEELGMKTVAERSAALLSQAHETAGAREPIAATASQDEILRREGDYWTVSYEGAAFRLRDTKGLQYLAHLLRHPREEFHVADLVAAIGGQDTGEGTPAELRRTAGLGDAGELLDPQARAEYKQRLDSLLPIEPPSWRRSWLEAGRVLSKVFPDHEEIGISRLQNDCLLALTARHNEALLITADQHFARLLHAIRFPLKLVPTLAGPDVKSVREWEESTGGCPRAASRPKPPRRWGSSCSTPGTIGRRARPSASEASAP